MRMRLLLARVVTWRLTVRSEARSRGHCRVCAVSRRLVDCLVASGSSCRCRCVSAPRSALYAPVIRIAVDAVPVRASRGRTRRQPTPIGYACFEAVKTRSRVSLVERRIQ